MGNEQSTNSQSSNAVKQTQAKPTGIVVVGTGQVSNDADLSDGYISRLNTCPTFEPIASLSTSFEINQKSSDLVVELDWKSALKASERLQEHLKACAEAVAFDQNSLTSQIKQLDQQSNQVLLKYTERQKAFAKHAEHTRKIEEISASLKRVRMRLDASFSMLEELNKYLPEEDQLKFQ